MRKFLSVIALTGLLGFTACTDQFGRVDPVATGLLGAGIGAAAGLAIASASQPRHARRHHYQGGWNQGGWNRGGWNQPNHGWHHSGWQPRHRGYW